MASSPHSSPPPPSSLLNTTSPRLTCIITVEWHYISQSQYAKIESNLPFTKAALPPVPCPLPALPLPTCLLCSLPPLRLTVSSWYRTGSVSTSPWPGGGRVTSSHKICLYFLIQTFTVFLRCNALPAVLLSTFSPKKAWMFPLIPLLKSSCRYMVSTGQVYVHCFLNQSWKKKFQIFNLL